MNVKLKEAKEKFDAWVKKNFSEETPAPEKTEEPTKDKFETVLLVDGETEVTIEPSVEVGSAIVIAAEDGTPVAAPAGEYELQDGRVIVVEEDGVIAAIQDSTPEEEPMKEDAPENAAQVKREIERIEKEKIFETEIVERLKDLEEKFAALEKENKFLHEENEAIKTKFSESNEEAKEIFNTLLEQPSKEPVENKSNPFKEFTKENTVDSWMEKHLID